LRIVVGLALVASLVVNYGIIDLQTAIAPGPEWESSRVLEGGWGIMFGVVLPIALVMQMRRGGGPVAAVQQMLVVTASLALATLLTTKTHEWLLVLVLLAFTAVIIALHPARSRLLAVGRKPDRVLAALAMLAAVPAGIYAEQMAANRRAGIVGDETASFEHWTVQSALPLCLVLLVALSALKTGGWRIPAATAAAGTAILGALAIMARDGLGDFQTDWGVAAIAWAALVGIVVIKRG
jgi:hypothetical protein